MLKGLKKPKKNKVYPERHRRVFVAMSGGVDSSVAALLLKKKGYGITGVFMRCYDPKDGCAQRDARDAALVAQKLKIPFYVWDFRRQYKKKVIEYMIAGYKNGLTPNPDVMCNKEIKFGLFLERALKLGADCVATGHYVKLKNSKLVIAKDLNKDQSYFLWTLTPEQLKYCLFPIGDYLKPQVRKIAKAAGLITADKKDSQGVCFLGKIKLEDFLKKYIPKKKGKILDLKGNIIGEHNGAQFYTIGQRHINAEIKFPSTKSKKDRQPYYVADKNKKKNIITIAEGEKNPALYKKEVELRDVNLHFDPAKKTKIPVLARVRYRQPLEKAMLIIGNTSSAHKKAVKTAYKLAFSMPVKFVASGQSAVIYDKSGTLLAGGIIL